MLLNPAVIALIAASVLVGTFTLYACGVAQQSRFWIWGIRPARVTFFRKRPMMPMLAPAMAPTSKKP